MKMALLPDCELFMYNSDSALLVSDKKNIADCELKLTLNINSISKV